MFCVGLTDRQTAYERLTADGADAATPFSLQGLRTWARVVSVHDGDTLALVLPLRSGCEACRFTARLSDIDACELRSRDPELRALAARARDRLAELVADGAGTVAGRPRELQRFLREHVALVWTECHRMDKYGRLLVTIRSDPESEMSFSDVLVAERLAYPYRGGTKLTETDQRETFLPSSPSILSLDQEIHPTNNNAEDIIYYEYK